MGSLVVLRGRLGAGGYTLFSAAPGGCLAGPGPDGSRRGQAGIKQSDLAGWIAKLANAESRQPPVEPGPKYADSAFRGLSIFITNGYEIIAIRICRIG